MEFRRNDPGAVQFGNFINYYQFNSAEERLKLLPCDPKLWSPEKCEDNTINSVNLPPPYLVLDVGCNTGDFTQLLWEHLTQCLQSTVYVLGVDIDQSLIERAEAVNKTKCIQYASLDVMREGTTVLQEFLAAHGCQQFDLVCCFSITMWIHLNYHDEGLQQFLQKMLNLSKIFVVEPQPWKCYQTAERRLKKTGEVFPLFAQLKWRSQVEQQIQNYLEMELGARKTFQCTPTKWRRQICFYRSEMERTSI